MPDSRNSTPWMATYKMLIKDFFLDALWEILYFPLWWYSRGFKKTFLFSWRKVKSGWRFLGIGIFLKNFFKPMYGTRGWDAYLLSIVGHSWQLFWRLVVVLGWAVFWGLVLCFWLVLPIFLIVTLFS